MDCRRATGGCLVGWSIQSGGQAANTTLKTHQIILGLVSYRDVAGLEDCLSLCVRQMGDRYREELVLVGNRILQS